MAVSYFLNIWNKDFKPALNANVSKYVKIYFSSINTNVLWNGTRFSVEVETLPVSFSWDLFV